jgi:hypothetical protein
MSNKAHTQAFFHSHFLGEKHNGLMNDCDIVIINKTHLVGYKSRGLCKRFYFDEDNKVETLKICVGD